MRGCLCLRFACFSPDNSWDGIQAPCDIELGETGVDAAVLAGGILKCGPDHL